MKRLLVFLLPILLIGIFGVTGTNAQTETSDDFLDELLLELDTDDVLGDIDSEIEIPEETTTVTRPRPGIARQPVNKETETTEIGAIPEVDTTPSIEIPTLTEALKDRINNARQVKAVVTDPIQLSISPFEAGKKVLSGRITFDEAPNETIQHVEFSISSNQYGKEWTQRMPWSSQYVRSNGVVRIPFSFDLKNLGIIGEKNLTATVFDAENQTVALKTKDLSFMQIDNEAILSKISNLTTEDTDQTITVKFDFRNHLEAGELTAQALVFEDSSKEKLLFTAQSESKALTNSEETEFEIAIEKPTQPKIYYVSVEVTRDETPETGTLEWIFQVEGDFATITNIKTSPNRFLTAGDELLLKVSGFTDQENQPLTAEVHVRSEADPSNTAAEFFVQEFAITADEYRYFNDEFVVPIQWDTPQTWGDIRLKKNGAIIGQKSFATDKFTQSSQSRLEDLKQNVSLFNNRVGSSKGIIIAGILIFIAIMGLIFVIIKFIRRQKRLFGLSILVLLASGLSFQSAQAVIIFEDTVYDYYRTTGDLAEEFDLIGFNGDSTDTEEANFGVGEQFLPFVTIRENVHSALLPIDGFTGGTVYSNLASPEITIESQGNFFFEIDLKQENDLLDPGRRKYRITNVTFIHNGNDSGGIPDANKDMSISFNGGSNPDPIDFVLNNIEPKVHFRHEVGGNRLLNPDDILGSKEEFFTSNPSEITNYFTNQPIETTILCGYSVSGDLPSDITHGNNADTAVCDYNKGGTHGQTINIRGNFCSDGTNCDNTGTRLFRICDALGQCNVTTSHGGLGTEVSLNNYDISAPTFDGGLEISNQDDPASSEFKRTDSSPLAALDNYIFKILNTYDNNAEDNATADIDLHACGYANGVYDTNDDREDFFYETTIDVSGTPTTLCNPKRRACAIDSHQRGVLYHIEQDSSSDWVPVASPTCVQECGVGESAVFCNAADQAIGLRRCCSADCNNIFPATFPICFQ